MNSIPSPSVVRMIIQLCEALAYLHGEGMVPCQLMF